MKKKIYELMLMVVLSLVGSNANAVSVGILGAGATCGKWANDRAEKNGWPAVSAAAYLSGLLSGMAIASNKDVLEANADGYYLWMDNYCRAHPLDHVSDAGKVLFNELMTRKGLH